MNTPKSILILGCALLTATLVSAQELSPDAKRQAEEALRQKMLELDQRSKAPAPQKISPPKNTTTRVVPPPAPKPMAPARDGVMVVPQAPKITAAPAPTKPALDPAVEAQARELLRMKLAQPEPVATPPRAPMPTRPGVVFTPTPAPQPAPQPVVVTVPTPVVVAAPTTAVVVQARPTTPVLDPAVESQARELLRAKIAESTAPAPAPAPRPGAATTRITKPASLTPANVVVVPANKPATPTVKKAAPPVVSKIPAPFAQSKVERLNQLTARYLADQITPHDYHLERAKIIAEP